jgi:hypothetical protein
MELDGQSDGAVKGVDNISVLEIEIGQFKSYIILNFCTAIDRFELLV